MTTQSKIELDALVADFFQQTKKVYPSCTFAALNVTGPQSDWNAWGDFTNREQAGECARMWVIALKGKVSARMVDGKYRIEVTAAS